MEERNQGLQAARAIAALMVAYFHSYVAIRGAFPETAWAPIPWLSKWGFVGVDFFFAISGYVICVVVSKPSFALPSFVIKRIFRLYPMYWVTMATVAFAIWWGRYASVPLGDFLYSMTLLPQRGAPAYEMSWTLEREMIFYTLTALIVPIGGLWSLAIVLFGLGAMGFHYHNPWTFHLASTYQFDFLAGVFAFLMRETLSRIGGVVPLACGVAGLAAMTQRTSPYIIPVAMGLLVAGTSGVRLPWHRAPLHWLVRIGDGSYSLYLLHYIGFLVGSYASVVWLKLPHWAPQWLCEPWRFASIAACLLLSSWTWRAIERPMIELGAGLSRSLKQRPRRHVSLSIGRSAATLGETRGRQPRTKTQNTTAH